MDNIKRILFSDINCAKEAAAQGLPVVLPLYRIGAGCHLYKRRTDLDDIKGYMHIASVDYNGSDNPDALVTEVFREYKFRSFDGIILEISQLSPTLYTAANKLITNAEIFGIPIYLTESCYFGRGGQITAMPSTVGPENFQTCLRRALNHFNSQNTILYAVPRAYDCLPAHGCTMLTLENLVSLRVKYAPSCFFSESLSMNYFSFSNGGERHFVLFDDMKSFQQKLKLCETYGVDTVAIDYSELKKWEKQIRTV